MKDTYRVNTPFLLPRNTVLPPETLVYLLIRVAIRFGTEAKFLPHFKVIDKVCEERREMLLQLNKKINLPEISMGMTNDYLDALEYKSTYLRIGTGIFGNRTK